MGGRNQPEVRVIRARRLLLLAVCVSIASQAGIWDDFVGVFTADGLMFQDWATGSTDQNWLNLVLGVIGSWILMLMSTMD